MSNRDKYNDDPRKYISGIVKVSKAMLKPFDNRNEWIARQIMINRAKRANAAKSK